MSFFFFFVALLFLLLNEKIMIDVLLVGKLGCLESSVCLMFETKQLWEKFLKLCFVRNLVQIKKFFGKKKSLEKARIGKLIKSSFDKKFVTVKARYGKKTFSKFFKTKAQKVVLKFCESFLLVSTSPKLFLAVNFNESTNAISNVDLSKSFIYASWWNVKL